MGGWNKSGWGEGLENVSKINNRGGRLFGTKEYLEATTLERAVQSGHRDGNKSKNSSFSYSTLHGLFEAQVLREQNAKKPHVNISFLSKNIAC